MGWGRGSGKQAREIRERDHVRMLPLPAADVSTSWWDSLINMVVDVCFWFGGKVGGGINDWGERERGRTEFEGSSLLLMRVTALE